MGRDMSHFGKLCVEFLESPHAATDILLVDKEQYIFGILPSLGAVHLSAKSSKDRRSIVDRASQDQCHSHSIINQQLYQDFENCVFQRNGSAKLLEPKLDRQAQFSSFVALRNLSWAQVFKKGTKCYSEEFSKFCDQKMSCIITALNWTKKWPEQLLQSFVSVKCIWLLHLLAFSFYPPLMIQRVEENRLFNGQYMEDVFASKEKHQSPCRVKVMVMPGFYVQDQVLRCRVLCK